MLVIYFQSIVTKTYKPPVSINRTGQKIQYKFLTAYNLADAGFDVWMGNARGSRNSRHHVSLDPEEDHLEFFDFTWHEISVYDVPTMMDYILENTGKERLHYIGHSQGGTSFLVMTSLRSEYNDKIATAHLLAPAAYKAHFPNAFLRNLAAFSNVLWVSNITSVNYFFRRTYVSFGF